MKHIATVLAVSIWWTTVFASLLKAAPQTYFMSDSDAAFPIHSMEAVKDSSKQRAELPKLVHLALGTNESSMVISYVHNLGPQSDWMKLGSFVRYGNKPGVYDNLCIAKLHTYYLNAGLFADCALYGLKPETKYYYVIGNSLGWTVEKFFKTPPLLYTRPHKTVFGLFGDMGVTNSNGTLKLLNTLADSQDLDVVVHLGDIAYADLRAAVDYETSWDKFFHSVEPLASRIPYMVAVGDHEYAYNYTVYKERFRMPGLEKTHPGYSGTNMWYSFEYGNMHFVVLSTEPDATQLREGSAQYNWLVADLERALERKQNGEIDWIFVLGHRPMYCSYNWTDCCNGCGQKAYSDDWDRGSFASQLRDVAETILMEYTVDLYISAHVHGYERMWPTYHSIVERNNHPDLYINPRYTVHTVCGAAGNVEGLSPPAMSWTPSATVTRIAKYGFVKMTVYGNDEIHWEFYGTSGSDYGKLLDEFRIKKL